MPGVPLSKPDLIAAVKEKGLRSVSAVFNALAGGKEDPGSRVGLASLLRTNWGAVATEGGKWEIYIGGAAGPRLRKGDLLCVVDSHAAVLTYMGRFMQYYREHAKYQERTYDSESATRVTCSSISRAIDKRQAIARIPNDVAPASKPGAETVARTGPGRAD